MNPPAEKFSPPAKIPRLKKEKALPPILQVAKEFTIGAHLKGCPADQIENFLKAGIFLQSKQLEFCAMARQCDLPDGPKVILCGGGRGSAKSHGILAQIFCDDCQRVS